MTAASEFKQTMVEKLETLADELHFADVTAGEDQVVATARVTGLGAGIEPKRLNLRQDEDFMIVTVQNVLFIGSPGCQTNRIVEGVARRLHRIVCKDEKLERDGMEHLGLMVDLFQTQRRSMEDLLAMVVSALNNWFKRTHAVVDFYDGEVFIEMWIPSDGKQLPEMLHESLLHVLRHAEVLVRFERLARRLLAAEAGPSMELIEKLDGIEGRVEDAIERSATDSKSDDGLAL